MLVLISTTYQKLNKDINKLNKISEKLNNFKGIQEILFKWVKIKI
jgi:prefoldin subunit 5